MGVRYNVKNPSIRTRKRIGAQYKKLIETLENDFKIEVKSHMSTLEEDVIETIKELYSDTGKKKLPTNRKK